MVGRELYWRTSHSLRVLMRAPQGAGEEGAPAHALMHQGACSLDDVHVGAMRVPRCVLLHKPQHSITASGSLRFLQLSQRAAKRHHACWILTSSQGPVWRHEIYRHPRNEVLPALQLFLAPAAARSHTPGAWDCTAGLDQPALSTRQPLSLSSGC